MPDGGWLDAWSEWKKWTVLDEVYSLVKKVIVITFGGGLLAGLTHHSVLFGICIGIFGSCVFVIGMVWVLTRKKKDQQQTSPDQTQTKAAFPLVAADFYRQFDNQFVTNIETTLREQAANYVAGVERENHLIRAHANTLYCMAFELCYHGAFGSQLKVLRLLSDNPNGVPISQLHRFYEDGVAQLPMAYTNRSFNDWFNWIVGCQLITQEGETIRLTPLGKELLKYIVERSYSISDRLG